MRISWLAVCWVACWGLVASVAAGGGASHAQNELAGRSPDAVCAGCHAAIYARYEKTPMARASGAAAEGFLPGRFRHEASGVAYRMEQNGGRVFLQFERESPDLKGRDLKGRRELRYFLGSGRRGRTYLFEQEGYWFEAPINWYGKKRVWDMAPGFLETQEMPLTLPVDPGCLRCHATGAANHLPEARNKYAGEPFAQGGIGCSACHEAKPGDAARHVASGGKVAMLRVGELAPVQRDSVCLNCHLEGEAVVAHRGKSLVDFRPGENLFDYASYFVRDRGGADQSSAKHATLRRATSQWEALLQSGCRRGVGEKLTCTSCHDAHGTASAITAAERVEYYRGRCLSCHEAGSSSGGVTRAGLMVRAGFGERHHAENRDCVSCHMPQANADDIAHEQVTDHSIPRIVRSTDRAKAAKVAVEDALLVAVADGMGRSTDTGARELGLAYAQLAVRASNLRAREDGARARELLREAERLPDGAADAEIHAQLGFLAQVAGEPGEAEREYGLALAEDGHDAFAAGNLGLLKVQAREYGTALMLWERAFGNDPVQVKAGMNLAVVQCGLGRREAALGTLDRVLAFAPDDRAAQELSLGIRTGTHGCRKR